jgi:prevent-host-death family protein
MSTSIGIFEAKTKLSQIIERVMLGEEFIITKHDKAVARIVPENIKSREQLIQEYEKFKIVKAKLNPKGSKKISLKDLAREGLR